MKTQNAIIPFFALISAIPAFAGIPDAVTYAGTLNQGSAPANGTFTVVFDLFDAPENGTRVFGQTEASLAVSQTRRYHSSIIRRAITRSRCTTMMRRRAR